MRARGTLTAVAVALALMVLTACGGSSRHNEVPRSYITSTYTASGAYYLASNMAPASVASDISRESKARDRVNKRDKVYLRYHNDVVAITKHEDGSRIEILNYRSAHSTWNTDIGTIWPAPGSSGTGSGSGGGGFRGGGPGSGK
ncbi:MULTISPECIES: DUF4247 domain-containing protein [unclassified Streptomyces]|uniref:DUF4247 domain-containing protein n=1 Tax=unclassified Streptomyces TaxID=2593676 RepID=UPI000CD5C457|nr:MULTISPECIES: DUF4247 domain-containing protein [unclassified Streptomyces]